MNIRSVWSNRRLRRISLGFGRIDAEGWEISGRLGELRIEIVRIGESKSLIIIGLEDRSFFQRKGKTAAGRKHRYVQF